MKGGKEGRTLTVTVRIVTRTYTMEITLFYLQPATVGLLLSYYYGYGTWDKISWGDRYGTAALLQIRKRKDAQPPPLYDPLLGQIEAEVNDDPNNLIVDGMEGNYEFILAHQIREFMNLWDREDDASR